MTGKITESHEHTEKAKFMNRPTRHQSLTLLALTLLTLALFALPAASQSRHPPADISGNWAATTYYDNGHEDSTITITLDGDIVTVAATTGSNWTGSFDQNTRIFKAYYTRGPYTGKVALQLNDRGDVLEGTWVSFDGDSGRYIARRENMTLSALSPHKPRRVF